MMLEMEYSEEAHVHLTEACEGLELKVYPDPGTGGAPWTAGYGHTGPDVKPGMTVTKLLADVWLLTDLQIAVNAVNRLVTVGITQHQFDALVDFTFNEGAERLEASTLLAKLNKGDTAGADAEFSKWVYGGGHKLPGLVKRRQLESQWFDTADVQ